MTDAEYEAQKARVERLQERWFAPLGLRWWQVSFIWDRSFYVGDDPEGNYRRQWDVEVEWQYCHAAIHVYLPMAEQRTDAELEESFLHECMHILLAEMRPESDGERARQRLHEERVATVLARAFAWTREAGQDDVQSRWDRATAEAADAAYLNSLAFTPPTGG